MADNDQTTHAGYDPAKIEQKWQKRWEETRLYATPQTVRPGKKRYILPQLPYPSGSGLHVGHAEVYTACDIYARYLRMNDFDVLQVIGWDAFGLPAENYAIKTNVHPRKSTNDAIDNFRSQIQSLGISVDWEREVGSHNPDYYQWTQWLFLLMHKRGLAYRKKQAVNWCESCKTVLANEQVVDGACERCSTEIVQREMEQWYLRITDYADRLHADLNKVDWPKATVERQRNWIGKSEGARIDFVLHAGEQTETVQVFTTRPDTLFGCTYMVLAPEHPFLTKMQSSITNWDEVSRYISETTKKTELDRQIEKEKTGVRLEGVSALHPVTGESLPVFIADYVLATYGTGAVMAVPAHDERDFVFAKKYGLPIVSVVESEVPLAGDLGILPYTDSGVCVDSDFLNNLTTHEAKRVMIDWLEKEGKGAAHTNYKLRDWSVSRQRFWGAPIPMLYDADGALHPVPESDLPVILPDDVDFIPTGQSPLTYSAAFQAGVEERYGKGWRREPDTLDTFMCSSWYFFRYLDPHNDTAFAGEDMLKQWMPVDFYLGGEEHVNGHLLYARFITKVLFDAGYISFDEPFLKHRHQGLILGEDSRKMSKRWGNVISPTDVVNTYGADTCRMYEMFMGPLEETKPWSENGVKGLRRFLEKVYRLRERVVANAPMSGAAVNLLHKTIKKVGDDTNTLQFNTAIAKMMELVNAWQKEDAIGQTEFESFVCLLAPYAPHLAEELWASFGHTDSVTLRDWPVYDSALLVDDEITLAVQINGKVRSQIQVAPDAAEDEVLARAHAEPNVQKWLDAQPIKKVIYVAGKILNIVV